MQTDHLCFNTSGPSLSKCRQTLSVLMQADPIAQRRALATTKGRSHKQTPNGILKLRKANWFPKT